MIISTILETAKFFPTSENANTLHIRVLVFSGNRAGQNMFRTKNRNLFPNFYDFQRLTLI